MAKAADEPKRLNRAVGVAEALQRTLDPVFRKRGFASRDIVSRWPSIAPAPYDRIAAPDRLVWPRGERGAGGATLYLRCAPGHALALQHEGGLIAASINRYFGYVLVGEVRLAAEPFIPGSSLDPEADRRSLPQLDGKAEAALEEVRDEGLRDALRRLGRGIKGNATR